MNTPKPTWISREGIASIYDTMATRKPAETYAEQARQKKLAQRATDIRATELLSRPIGYRSA